MLDGGTKKKLNNSIFINISVKSTTNLHKSLSSVGTHLSFQVLMLIQKLCRTDGVVDRLCVGKHQRCGAVRLAHGIKNTNIITQTPKLSYILVLQPHV